MTSIPMGGFGGQPMKPQVQKPAKPGFGVQPMKPQIQKPMGGFPGQPQVQQPGMGQSALGGQQSSPFDMLQRFRQVQQMTPQGGFGGYGMPQQGGFGQMTPEQMRVMEGAPKVGGPQNSSARQSFEQFITSGGPRGLGAGLFNMAQGQQPQQPGFIPDLSKMSMYKQLGSMPEPTSQAENMQQQQQRQALIQQMGGQQVLDQYSNYVRMQQQPMVQPTPPQQQVEQATPQRLISGGPVSDQMQPMVQPPAPQQVEQANSQLSPARQYINAMQQRQQQKRMGQISGSPYSQQVGQEDPRMQAMRNMQMMNLGG